MNKDKYIQFIKENFPETHEIAQEFATNKPGRPKKKDNRAYEYVYALVKSVHVYKQEDGSLLQKTYSIREAISIVDKLFDFRVQSKGYYAWLNEQEPEIFPNSPASLTDADAIFPKK